MDDFDEIIQRVAQSDLRAEEFAPSRTLYNFTIKAYQIAVSLNKLHSNGKLRSLT